MRNNKKRLIAIVCSVCVIGLLLISLLVINKKDRADLVLSASYEINAELVPEKNILTFEECVQVKNTGADDTKLLYFHIYGNLYKTDDSKISVLSVKDSSGNPIQFSTEDDDQLLRLTLNDPLISNSETTITFTCTATIPIMTVRYGVARDGEIHMPFFYPQLAVYDENGWDTAPMNDIGDGRYAEISNYNFTITAPNDFVVAANGTQLSYIENGDTVTYSFAAPNRRDLIFIAYNDYTRMDRTVGKTQLIGYFNNNQVAPAMMNEIMDTAEFSIKYFSENFCEYPYETLVITNAAHSTKATVSMEYSGLISVSPSYDFELVVCHEMAHQWFYSLIGNNENAEPWLDEAFAQFSSLICYEANGQAVDDYWDVAKIQADTTKGTTLDCAFDETDIYTNHFYGRGSYFLKELMDAIGRDEFFAMLSEYCNRFAYKNATTQDFLDILEEYSSTDVSSIVKQYIF